MRRRCSRWWLVKIRTTRPRPRRKGVRCENYAAALQRDGLKGARIGVLRQAYERDDTDPEIVSVFMTAVEDLKRAGAVIVDPARVALDDVRRDQGAGPCMGFKYDINRYLASHGDKVPVRSLAEIVKSNRFHPTVQRRLEQAEQGAENGPDTPACKAEQEYRERVRQAVLQVMDASTLDAFVYPTWSNPPRLIGDLNTPAGDNCTVLLADHRIPGDSGADGLHARRRAAGGDYVLRTGVVGGDADQAGLRLRAGHASPARAGVDAAAALGRIIHERKWPLCGTHFNSIDFATNSTLAGRSARRLMYHGNQCAP